MVIKLQKHKFRSSTDQIAWFYRAYARLNGRILLLVEIYTKPKYILNLYLDEFKVADDIFNEWPEINKTDVIKLCFNPKELLAK